MRTWGRVDSVGVWLPRDCFAGAHLRLPTSKQGGQCPLLISCAGCGACPRSLASLRQSLRAPSVPHSLLSSRLRLQGPRLCHNTGAPAEVRQTARCSDSLLTPSPPHLSRTEPSGSSVTHFSPKSSHLCLSFFSTSRAHHCSPPPALPSCRAAASALPPETVNLVPGHHPDCCLQGSPSGQTGYISYKLVASTVGVYILGPIQTVMQGNYHLKRYMHPVFTVVPGTAARTWE